MGCKTTVGRPAVASDAAPAHLSVRALVHWDPASGTGLAKEGCCGYRHARRCGGCGRVAYADAMVAERCAACAAPAATRE